MKLTPNRFKAALAAGENQIGIWSNIRDTAVTEMLGHMGFDWLLIDSEHAPRDMDHMFGALQSLGGSATEAVARPTHLDVAEIKRLLDIGARSLIVPYVQTVEEAELAAAAVAYPPDGIRGVAGGVRGGGYGANPDYFKAARDEICLIVQIETKQALDNVEAIAAVPGIDGLFIGPADLAASLGHLGDMDHPEVKEAIADGLRRIRAAGKPAGFLAGDPDMLDMAIDAGSKFTAVGIDNALLRNAAQIQLSRYKPGSA